jgi:hypothetical protein
MAEGYRKLGRRDLADQADGYAQQLQPRAKRPGSRGGEGDSLRGERLDD